MNAATVMSQWAAVAVMRRLDWLRLLALDSVGAVVGLACAFFVHAALDPAVPMRVGSVMADVVGALPLVLGAIWGCFLAAGLFRGGKVAAADLAATLAMATAVVAFVVMFRFAPGPRPWLFAIAYGLILAAVWSGRVLVCPRTAGRPWMIRSCS